MPDSAPHTPAFFGAIPSGVNGVKATLRVMVDRCRKFRKPRAGDCAGAQKLLMLRNLAQAITLSVPEGDAFNEVRSIQQFVRDHIKYTHDMVSAETLQDPDYTLSSGSGDCDDKSILFACLVECIGYPARFCAIAIPNCDDPQGEVFSHVSPQALIDGCGWVNAECIPIDRSGTKVDLGWFPPDASCLMLAHI
jgi:hypothetical protein